MDENQNPTPNDEPNSDGSPEGVCQVTIKGSEGWVSRNYTTDDEEWAKKEIRREVDYDGQIHDIETEWL